MLDSQPQFLQPAAWHFLWKIIESNVSTVRWIFRCFDGKVLH